MSEPKVQLKYHDNTDDRGYIQPIINGYLKPCVAVSFDLGNNPTFLRQLEAIIVASYSAGYNVAESENKKRILELIHWAQSK